MDIHRSRVLEPVVWKKSEGVPIYGRDWHVSYPTLLDVVFTIS
jgi:hypothetical protein